jgi:peroxiredoxin
MRKQGAAYVVVAFLGLLLFVVPAQAATSVAAPNFTLQDLQGNSFTLNDYAQRQPIMILFWTTWCPFCRDELKSIASRHDTLVKDGLKFVAINVGESPGKVEAFASRYNYPFAVFLDKDSDVALSYDLLGVPTYVLIDRQGSIRTTVHTFPESEYKKLIAE